MTPSPSSQGLRPRRARTPGLNYKFQRLRERLRQAIANGELSGKLPGERALARRLSVNPKTLSKALTDLAAEGVLDRSIGRGTYVKGSAPAEAQAGGKWLIVCDPEQTTTPLVEHLMRLNEQCEITCNPGMLRPSFINQFTVAIDVSRGSSEAFQRGLVLRGTELVLVGREPRVIRTHAVLIDRADAAFRLGRDLLLLGHRRLAVVADSDSALADALRLAIMQYAPTATLETRTPQDAGQCLDGRPLAIVCDGTAAAAYLRRMLQQRDAHLSLAAIGYGEDDVPCSGYYTSEQTVAQTTAHLLRDTTNASRRPATLWLASRFIDRGTIHAPHPDRLTPLAVPA